MKLWKVKCRGMGIEYTNYVVAENPDVAYKIVRKAMEDKDFGFKTDRELETITLLAEQIDISYPDCETHLYIEGE